MKDFRNKVIVVTGAASGMGRELAVKLGQRGARSPSAMSTPTARRDRAPRQGDRRSGAQPAAQRRRARGGARVRADRGRSFRQGQRDLQQCRDRLRRDRAHGVQGHRPRDGRRLLGRGERHEGLPAAHHRLRRRAHREHVVVVRPVVRAGPVGLQLGQVRSARVRDRSTRR